MLRKRSDAIVFEPCRMSVDTSRRDTYGATEMTPNAKSQIGLSVAGPRGLAQVCLAALEGDVAHDERL